MQIGAVSFRPYIYNTNAVGPASMNKISAIGKDALQSKTDISALTSEDAKKSEVLNPLKRGESLDFAGIIGMQMQMSRMNAERLMPKQNEQAASEVIDQAATQKITPVNETVSGAYQSAQDMSVALGFNATV